MASCDDLDLGWLMSMGKRLVNLDMNVLTIRDLDVDVVNHTNNHLLCKVNYFKVMVVVSSLLFNRGAETQKEFKVFCGWLSIVRVCS